jgi:3D-(3,5/4)-trihydroxycyclohexane-1,2-dione acylhydrolase (decyclizing)
MRLTVAQALVRFLANQWTERDGERHRLIAGCFGIFGHGNVAGLGEALRAAEAAAAAAAAEAAGAAGATGLPYRMARNEQAMVHTAVGYARMRNRLSAYACTTSIGPGATNLVTGAALATVNRIPVLLLPGDTFATRVAEPVLQQLEHPGAGDLSVNDTLRPVSRYFDRVGRPEQLAAAALAAMRVLADPAETGAVTLALPQDVQAEAYDFDPAFFAPRVWRVRRPVPDAADLADAAALLRSANRPLIVAGGGVIYSEATGALATLAEATGIPVAETQAGKGALPYDHPLALGAIGATGSTAANAIAAEADVVLGVGTRWSDFTTASHTAFRDPGVRFVNLNVAAFDAAKHAGVMLVGDARAGLTTLGERLTGYRTGAAYQSRVRELAREWDSTVDRTYHPEAKRDVLTQGEVLGAVNDETEPRDVVVCAAGSMPGELHKLWRTRDPKGYHVEYGYSCMGYEIAGGLGVKLAAPDREVIVLVGDGSYLMMSQELVTAIAEGVKLTVVLVDNGGYASIGALSESVGVQRFGTAYRYRDPATGRLDGDPLPVDLAANAASLGADVLRVSTVDELRAGLAKARQSTRTTVLYVRTDPLVGGPDSASWWDVPVAEVSELDTATAAREAYQRAKQAQRQYL